MSASKTNSGKKPRAIRLRDGYTIISPPSGGRLSKREIEKAVREVVSKRQAKAS